MHPYLEQAVVVLRHVATGLYYAAFAVRYIFGWLWYLLLTVLKPVIWLLDVFAQPAIVMGQFVASILSIPTSVVRSFETLYTFLGFAALVGTITGLSLYSIWYILDSALGLNPSGAEPSPGLTVDEFRARRRKKERQLADGRFPGGFSTSSSTLVEAERKPTGKKRSLMTQNTIFEDEVSKY